MNLNELKKRHISELQELANSLGLELTRARKQMIIMGVPQLLALNPIYQKLLNFIKMKADFTYIRSN